MSDALMATYARQPVAFVRGEGARLWDVEGREYLDALSGIAVCGLGHAHPGVRDAICTQAGTLIHTSNLYEVPVQRRLAERLTAISGMDRVFFANSGAEANEAAIKIARRHGHDRKISNPAIVVMEGSFHGRTMATLTATGNRKVQAGFEPLVQGFVRVPYDDLDALEAVARNRNDVVAVLLEPLQGEGGVRLPAADFLAGVRAICDANGWLMMVDEIQTGAGRTGAFTACQLARVNPDVMTLAKGLGNGVPIGTCLASGAAAEILGPGSHGSTFGGNPLACAAGNAVLDALEEESLIARAAELGGRIRRGLATALEGTIGVVEVRGLGLLIGTELDRPCGALVGRALEQGLLINVTAERVVRLLPPLVLDDSQAERIIEEVAELIQTFLAED